VWGEEALCAGHKHPDLWFPNANDIIDAQRRGYTLPAVLVCRMCPVQVECADYALNHPQGLRGVWGGLTEDERAVCRRSRGLRNLPQPNSVCGSEAGAKRHSRAGERECDACHRAKLVARNERKKRKRRERLCRSLISASLRGVCVGTACMTIRAAGRAGSPVNAAHAASSPR